MEILPPSPPCLLILPPHTPLSLSFSPPPFLYPPPFLSPTLALCLFFLSCVHPPWCLESSSFSVSIPVHSNLFSLPAECLFQPLTTFSPLLSIFVPGGALPPCLLNCASNHFLSSRLLLLVSPSPLFQACSSLFPLNPLLTHSSLLFLSISLLFPSSPSLRVHQMVHFSLTQCILIPMAAACRVRAVKTTATVY